MSNAFDKASLVMLPHAYEDGKLYSLKPTDRSGDFTFSRGSDTATRVNASGNIEKETQNLFLQSNNFSTTWTTNASASVTSGQAGYDGSNNAWKLVPNTSTSSHYVLQEFSVSGVRTISIYAKPSGYDYMLLYSGSNGGTFFDLVNGTITNNIGTTPIDATITSAGNGFYRCSIVVNAGNDVSIWPSPDGINYTYAGDGTSGILIQDAQLNQGLVAQDYLETTTAPVYGGLTDNTPRLDYSGGATCPSLLLEPERTNKITNSEYISTSTFSFNNLIGINNNHSTSPEGVQNAAKITADASSGYHQLRTGLATPSGYDIISCFVKASGYNYVQLASWADPANYVNFDLTDGSIGSVGNNGPSIKDIEDYGNGWYRIHANVQASGGGLIGIGIVTSASAGWAQSFTGNGTNGILVWGVQLEAGSYPTSYIPTYGSSQTRAADDASQLDITDLTSTYNTLYAEFEVNDITNQGKIALSDNSQANRMTIYQNGDDLMLLLNAGGTAQTAITSSNILVVGTNYKVVAKNQNGSHALFINGTKISEESSTTPTGLNKLRFGNEISSNSTQKFLGNIKKTLVFSTALSDDECIALTQN